MTVFRYELRIRTRFSRDSKDEPILQASTARIAGLLLDCEVGVAGMYYSYLSNKRVMSNKRVGWKMGQN